MITINFLQTKSLPKTNRFSRIRFTLACLISITSLLIGNNSLAKVPEDFMERPIIITPSSNSVVPRDQFEIRGTAHNWAHVNITIDGVYAGRATSMNGKGSNATFSFKPGTLSVGTHWIQAEVRSETEVFRSPLTTSVLVHVVEPTPAPTLLTFAGSNDFRRPYIRGVAVANTRVDIFVDGRLDQSFDARGVESTISFSVQPRTALANGFHTVTAKSTNVNGTTSKPSNQRVFLVEAASTSSRNAPGLTGKPSTGPSNPAAPTLLRPENGNVVNARKAQIQGVAHNNLTIQAYVDGSLEHEIPVTSHLSGTGSFSFATRELESGFHNVYAIARDTQGRTSSRSNELEFLVAPEGQVQQFTSNGERSVWFPTLPIHEPGKQTPTAQPKPTTQTTRPSNVNQGRVNGDQATTTATSTAVTNGTNESSGSERRESGVPARVIIGWIILGISILGIIAYAIAAIIEHRQKKQTTQIPSSSVNFHQSSNQQKQTTNNIPAQKQTDDELGLNDDIPKGYQ